MLVPVLDPFHRPPEPQRARGRPARPRDRARRARRSRRRHGPRTDGSDDSGRAEDLRKLLAIAMRHLGGAVQFQEIARRVVARDGAAGFQRHRRMTADRDVRLDNGVSSAERGGEVAVALLDDHRLGREPVDFHRIVVGRHHRRQFVELDDHPLGRVFGAVGIVGEHHRHRLADITHAARAPAAAGGAARASRPGRRGNRSGTGRRGPRRSRPRPHPARRSASVAFTVLIRACASGERTTRM